MNPESSVPLSKTLQDLVMAADSHGDFKSDTGMTNTFLHMHGGPSGRVHLVVVVFGSSPHHDPRGSQSGRLPYGAHQVRLKEDASWMSSLSRTSFEETSTEPDHLLSDGPVYW